MRCLWDLGVWPDGSDGPGRGSGAVAEQGAKSPGVTLPRSRSWAALLSLQLGDDSGQSALSLCLHPLGCTMMALEPLSQGRVSWPLNEGTQVKCLEEFLDHRKCSQGQPPPLPSAGLWGTPREGRNSRKGQVKQPHFCTSKRRVLRV